MRISPPFGCSLIACFVITLAATRFRCERQVKIPSRETPRGGLHSSHLYLVDIGILFGICQHIESCVELVEHVDNLHSAVGVRVSGAVSAEADYPGEQEGNAVVLLGWYRSRMPELVRHRDGKHRVEQSARRKGIFHTALSAQRAVLLRGLTF